MQVLADELATHRFALASMRADRARLEMEATALKPRLEALYAQGQRWLAGEPLSPR
jgi:hypothetical protein